MRSSIEVTSEFGIVIRKAALNAKGVDKGKLPAIFAKTAPFDENDDLLSYGPHFGEEAMEELGKQLRVGTPPPNSSLYLRKTSVAR
jgi:hypothetical protein